MAKVRQDAWSHQDDLLLAETVLRHVREGSTQLNAFEEVGDILNRTSAACGFRWNAEVRNKYDQAMELAKRQRKERKRTLKSKQEQNQKIPKYVPTENTKTALSDSNDSSLTMEAVIHFLTSIQSKYIASNQSQHSIERLTNENETLRNQVLQLEKDLKQTEAKLTNIQEDYQTFIEIMDRARKMTVLGDQGTLKAPAFKMDKNGNLEQLAEGQYP